MKQVARGLWLEKVMNFGFWVLDFGLIKNGHTKKEERG